MTALVEGALDERLRLRDGVFLGSKDCALSRISAWPRSFSLAEWSDVGEADLRALLHALSVPQGVRSAGESDPTSSPRTGSDDRLTTLLSALRADGWLAITVELEGRPIYTIHPLQRPPGSRPQCAPDELKLSRLAVLRAPETRHPDMARQLMVAECPTAWADVWIHDPRAAAVVADPRPGADEPAYAPRLRADLFWTGHAVDGGAGEFRTLQWSAHELWFHDRSRVGRRSYLGDGFGGTFWARGTVPPLPARPRPYGGTRRPLPVPDLQRCRQTDPSLTTVLEDRRSIRLHDPDHPPTVAELGEFLYRTCRTREIFVSDGVEYASRVYPAGGSVGEIEVYPLVSQAAGLPPGLYHYDSHEHCLRDVCRADDPAVRRLSQVAKHSTIAGRVPQVVLLLSARFGRLAWKYEDMAYALVLKHVGVLYQTMYCVATAMGLAACGLGSGDSVSFAEATGRDRLEECAVGEFALGRPATTTGQPEPVR